MDCSYLLTLDSKVSKQEQTNWTRTSQLFLVGFRGNKITTPHYLVGQEYRKKKSCLFHIFLEVTPNHGYHATFQHDNNDSLLVKWLRLKQKWTYSKTLREGYPYSTRIGRLRNPKSPEWTNMSGKRKGVTCYAFLFNLKQLVRSISWCHALLIT